VSDDESNSADLPAWDPEDKVSTVERLHSLMMSAVLDGKQEYFYDWLEKYLKNLRNAGFNAGYTAGWNDAITTAMKITKERI
jgi:hypothetical protein